MRNYNRLPKTAFRPLRITARLQCGVISDEYLPIDGLLYSLVHRDILGAQMGTISGASLHGDTSSSCVLPLARCEEHVAQWYYAASFARWSRPAIEGSDHWNHKFDVSLVDLIDWQGRKPRLDVSSGRYKAYHMPVFYRHALTVHWFVLGEPRRIGELLAHATHIGKKTSQGWGSVLEWEVEREKEDYSVRDRDGRLMRAIPSERGLFTGFRPSYWLPKNQAVCELPGCEDIPREITLSANGAHPISEAPY